MASVFFDKRGATWWVKWKAVGGWRRDKLGKHPSPFPKDKPPKKPPAFIDDRAAPFLQRERDAKAGGTAGQSTGLDGFVAAYSESFAKSHAKGSAECLEKVVRVFLVFCKSRKVDTVQGVTKAICRDFLDSLVGKLAPTTIKVRKAYVSAIFNRAADEGLIPNNPWKGVKSPGKPEPSPAVFWSGEEVDRITAALRSAWHKDIVRFMANTGLRASAALVTEFSWADTARGVITIPGHASKSGKPYEVPMTEVARQIVGDRRKDSASKYVFAKKSGEAFGYGGFHDAFTKAVARSGVRPGTPHDLRHTYARSLCKAGVPINVVQRALGHASLAMTQRYTDVTADAALEHMGGFRVGSKPAEPTEGDNPPKSTE